MATLSAAQEWYILWKRAKKDRIFGTDASSSVFFFSCFGSMIPPCSLSIYIWGAADRSGRGKRCSSFSGCWGGGIFHFPIYSFLGRKYKKLCLKRGVKRQKLCLKRGVKRQKLCLKRGVTRQKLCLKRGVTRQKLCLKRVWQGKNFVSKGVWKGKNFV